MCEPRNHLLSILLFPLGVFALRRCALTGAESTNIYPYAHVPSTRKVGVLGIILRSGAVVLAIGKIFEQSGKLLAPFCTLRDVQRGGEAYAIIHRNPRLLHTDSVHRSGRSLNCRGTGGEQRKKEKWASNSRQGSLRISTDLESLCGALIAAQRAHIDSKLFRLFIQVATLKAKSFRCHGHVVLSTLELRQDHLALERFNTICQRSRCKSPRSGSGATALRQSHLNSRQINLPFR